MSEVIYTVRIKTAEFPAESRRRAGIVVPSDGGYVGPLDADQLKAIKADELLTVTKGGDSASDDVAAKAAEQVVEAAKAEAEKIVAEAKKAADKK